MICDECGQDRPLFHVGRGIRLCAVCRIGEAKAAGVPSVPTPRPEIDDAVIDTIVEGQHTPACLTIGQANLSTIQRAEQLVTDALAVAKGRGEPCGGYDYRLKLVRGRRHRLQQEAQQREAQGSQPATIRL